MNFNLDPSKQVQEVIFSRNLLKRNHNQVYFNHNSVKQIPSQKHLGMYLDTKLNFQEHLNNVLSKVNKTIGSSKLFYRANLQLRYMKHLQDPISTTGILFTTKPIMTVFIKKWSQYNNRCTSYNRRYKSYFQKKTFIKNQAQNHSIKDYGIENSSTCSKYLRVNLRSISSEYFLALAKHLMQELMIRFPSSVVNIFSYKFFFSISCH